MAKKKEPVAWITMNGVHVPIYEGESKEDAVKRSISKAKENVKANEDQKEKDIARNKAEKDKLNDSTKLSNDQLLKKYKEVSWKDSANIRHAEAAKLEKEISDRGLKVDHYKDNDGNWKDRLIDKNTNTNKSERVDFTNADQVIKLSKEMGTNDVNKLAEEISHRNHQLMSSTDKTMIRRALEKGSISDASAGKASDEVKEAAIKEAYEKQKSFKDTTYEVMEKDGKYVVVGGNNNGSADPGSWHAKKNDYRDRGYKELPDSDYENFRNSLKKGSLSDSSSGKAVDGVKGSSGNKDWSKQDIQKLADSRKISYDEAKKIVERYNKPDNAGDAAVDRFRNASSGKAVDNEKVRLKGISDTINAIDRDKLNYTYDKDKNEYVISKKDYDKMYNDAVNKKYIENLQVGKGSGELQTHGYLKGSLSDASSGKAVDEARVRKEENSGNFREQAKSIVAKEKDSWKNIKTTPQALSNIRYLSKHELKDIPDGKLKEMYPYHKNQVGVEIAEELLNRGYQKVGSGWQIKVPKSFAANYPNLSSTQLKAKYEEYLKKNRK